MHTIEIKRHPTAVTRAYSVFASCKGFVVRQRHNIESLDRAQRVAAQYSAQFGNAPITFRSNA